MIWLIVAHVLFFLISVIGLFSRKRKSSGTLAWFYFILFVPILGPLVFLAFGSTYVKEFSYSSIDDGLKSLQPERQPTSLQFEFAEKNLGIQTTLHNDIELKSNEDDCLTLIKDRLMAAQSYILLEYYIILNDEVGDEILTVLADVAKKGIAVYVLYDWYGSYFINRRKLKQLKKWGAKTKPFYPLYNIFRKRNPSLRNHRKLIVIDGVSAISGSANIGNRYLRVHKTRANKDYFLFLRGTSCSQLDQLFRADWLHVSGEPVECAAPQHPKLSTKSLSPVQVIPTGPNQPREILSQIIFNQLMSARESIVIVTPYFIPTDAIMMALKIQSQKGISVTVLVPKRSDSVLASYAAKSYCDQLMEYNIQFYEFSKSFLHFKCLLTDGREALLGTFNLDYRSLVLNYEISYLLDDPRTIKELQRQIKRIQDQSDLYQKTDHSSQRFVQELARAWSPLL